MQLVYIGSTFLVMNDETLENVHKVLPRRHCRTDA